MTDLRHLAQLLNRAATVERLGLTALSRWLTDRISDDQFAGSADRSRLLDRDHAAVRIVTIHASKGLEFPIVYLPFSWDGWKPSSPASLLLHENGQRIRDVGGQTGPGYTNRRDPAPAGGGWRGPPASLRRTHPRHVPRRRLVGTHLQHGHRPTAPSVARAHPRLPPPPPKPSIPADAALASVFEKWAAPVAGLISVEAVPQPGQQPTAQWTPPPSPRRALGVAAFNRDIDTLWRRTSYTGLTAADHASSGATSETDEITTTDEPDVPTNPPGAAAPPGPGTRSLMNALPAGAAFGTLVHAVLERIDTDAADLAAEVRRRCQEAEATLLTSVDVETLADALTAVMTTPLGRGTLADVASTDRLAELDFELPLAGGDAPTGPLATLRRIADLLPPTTSQRTTCSPPTPTCSAPSRRCRFADFSQEASTRCFATPGLSSSSSTTRRTGSSPAPSTRRSSTSRRWPHEMMRSHYPLQALLYSVALHRYLRWRLPGYSPRQQPRRSAVPVRPRDDRPRHAGRVRRLRLAPAGGTRRGTVGPAGGRYDPVDDTAGRAATLPGRGSAHRWPTFTRPYRCAGSAREPDEQVRLALALAVRACAACGSSLPGTRPASGMSTQRRRRSPTAGLPRRIALAGDG